jgi:hypothetical protein
MSSPPDPTQLWSDLICGQDLSAAEQDDLRDAIEADDNLRERFTQDATLHALLLSLDDVESSEDQFVHRVLSRCDAFASDSPGIGPVNQDAVVNTVLFDSGDVQRRHRTSSRPHLRSTIVLASMIFLVGGLFAWSTMLDHRQRQIAKTEHNSSMTTSQSTTDRNHSASADSVPASIENEMEGLARTDDGQSAEGLLPNEAIVSEDAPSVESASRPFVTLTKLHDIVCEREFSIGDRVGSGTIRLFGGTMQLTFDDGAILNVEGPVEFQPMAAGLLRLRRGRLSATVPEQAIGFVVSTPTSKVMDLGTEFDVVVKDSGATDVEVRKGEVEVVPISIMGDDSKPLKSWRLKPEALNHASFLARVDSSKSSPIAVTARGRAGEFSGLISINGRAVEFQNEQTFQNVHQHAIKSFAKQHSQMFANWNRFVEEWNSSTIQGSVNVNGSEIPFQNLNDVMMLQQSIRKQLASPSGQNTLPADIPFSGTITINGQVRKFTSFEEYDAARREAFGPSATFGAGWFSRGED